MTDVTKEFTAKHENGVRVSDLATLGWQNQRSVLFLEIERQSRKPMLQEE